jgi:hypothetical protein
VVQDGDDEGILDLEGLPTPEQAVEIRDILGIRKRRDLSDEERERLAARMRGFRSSPGGDSSSDN